MTDYVVGRLGVRVIWRDGTHDDYSSGCVVRLDPDKRPARIIGRLYRLRTDGGLGYEAPELAPISSGGPPPYD